MVVEVPWLKTWVSVFEPRALVGPHYNHTAPGRPPPLSVPCNSTEVAATAVASLVVTENVVVWEYAIPVVKIKRIASRLVEKRPARLTCSSLCGARDPSPVRRWHVCGHVQ